jgi:hypothetical protein
MRKLMKRHPGSATETPTTGRRKRHMRLPTSGAALAVSIVALVVAMAGSAYAGVTLGKGSVGTKQLQKGAVTGGKIAKGAVSAGKLKAGLIVPNATHASTADSATNATNATNATKATTATNATNATNATKATTATSATTATNATNATNAITAANATALAKVTYVESASAPSPAATTVGTNPSTTFGSVSCPSGTAAIGGGFFTSQKGIEISDSEPTVGSGTAAATGWHGYVDNFLGTAGTFQAWAICTPVTAGVSTSAAIPLAKAASR